MKLIKSKKMVLISLVVCLSFLLLFSQAAIAADSVRLSASSEEGSTGDIVTVSITIENALGTEGGQFQLNFDPSVVVPDSISKGTFVSSASNDQFNYNLDYDASTMMVIWVTPYGDTAASGEVCRINFKAVGEGDSALTFSDVVFAPDTIAAAPTHRAGSVTVDEMTAKERAIKAADAAILALPSVDQLRLDDKPDVVAARALVNRAKDLGAVDSDFLYLSLLRAAENRITELEGLIPTPPTGGMGYLIFGGLILVALGGVAYIKRHRFASVK